MGARRQVSAHPERPGRPLRLALLLLMLLWPALLAPAHRHSASSPAAPLLASASVLASEPVPAGPASDTDSCPVCRELVQLAAFLSPPSTPLPPAPPVEALRPLLPTLTAVALPWRAFRHSRAPPLSPRT